ncbi:hypothetical protein KCP76_04430 [Salmonella enterica subsp. enterica serovar Weltevreden]|nr:hypothetical protein KCP76_04430 [Salmonella enterica subsp. enterica serovar Weltevreden]
MKPFSVPPRAKSTSAPPAADKTIPLSPWCFTLAFRPSANRDAYRFVNRRIGAQVPNRSSPAPALTLAQQRVCTSKSRWRQAVPAERTKTKRAL